MGAIARARCDRRHKIPFFGCLFNVRFTPESGHLQCNSPCPLCAKSGHETLFDHLVGDGEDARRDGQAKRLGGLEVDDKLELGQLDDRQVAGLFALEDSASVDALLTFANLCRLLKQDPNAPVTGQRCSGLSLCSAGRNHHVKCNPRRASSPLCAGLSFRYTQVSTSLVT